MDWFNDLVAHWLTIPELEQLKKMLERVADKMHGEYGSVEECSWEAGSDHIYCQVDYCLWRIEEEIKTRHRKKGE